MKQTRKQMVDAIKKHSPRYTAYKISVAEVKKLYDEGIRLRLIKEVEQWKIIKWKIVKQLTKLNGLNVQKNK